MVLLLLLAAFLLPVAVKAQNIAYSYDAAGNRISKLQKGVNIVIMGDGTTKKVMVK